MSDLHTYLRQRRQALGLSIHEAADAAGMTSHILLGLESKPSHRLPAPDVLARLAAALGVEPGTLLRAAGYSFDLCRESQGPLFTR